MLRAQGTPICDASFTYDVTGSSTTVQFYPTVIDSFSVYTYNWQFGDGTGSNEMSPTHQYNSNGPFVVCLFLLSDSCQASTCQTIILGNPPPSLCDASFTYNLTGSLAVQFNANGTGTAGNDSLVYVWDFGDGSGSNEMNPIHTYPSTGSFTACLTVLGDSCQDTTCQTIILGNTPPPPICDASFTYNLTGSLAVQFNANGTGTAGNDSLVYVWDFGDGSGSNEMNPIHTYPSTGSFTACLTVLGDSCQDTTCQTIILGNTPPPPICDASFTYNLTGSLAVQFIANGGGTGGNLPGDSLMYIWDFGDGTGSNEMNPIHLYGSTGPFTACLTVLGDSCQATSCEVISFGTNPPLCDSILTNIAGTVFLDNTLADHAQVFLYAATATGNFYLVDSTMVSPNTQGSYSFNDVSCGPFIVWSHLTSQSSEFGNYFPTYHLSTTNWQSATQIMNALSADIYMVPNDSIGGNGSVNGQLTGLNNFNNSAAIVVVLNSNGQPVTFGYLNLDGSFSIQNLPIGIYSLYVELPGMVSETFNFSISSATLDITGVEIEVTSNGFVFTGIEEVVIHGIDRIGTIYPIPATNHLSIDIVSQVEMPASASIYNLNGRLITQFNQTLQVGNNTVSIDLPDLSNGMYLLRLTFDGGQQYTKPILVQ